MRIGFIGLGKMGLPMATRLAAAGHPITGLVRTRRPDVEKLNARLVSSTPEVVEGAECVFLMVPGPTEVAEVIGAEKGALQCATRGTLFIDCSTSLPSLTRSLHEEASKRHARYVDAPVIGGPSVAAEGGLQFLVGATSDDFALALPLLQVLGKEIIHMGEPGSGHAAKIVNNMIALSNMTVLGEGMALAATFGLDAEKVTQMLSKGFGSSYVAQRHMPRIINGEFAPTFTLSMGLKDLALAADLAHALGYPLLMASTARSLYQIGKAMDFGEQNYTAIARVFERFGKPLRKKAEG